MNLFFRPMKLVAGFVLAVSMLSASFAVHETALAAPTPSPETLAEKLVGTPYKWGGTTPKGFDASGFTQYVYKNSSYNLTLPRTISSQYTKGKSVGKSDLKSGDLVFFKQGKTSKKVTFVGVYTSKNNFVATTTKGVKVQSLSSKTWKKSFVAAKRLR
ncbi:NlpC/P60 family protein [Marininema mesophilum]|uniref:NlpC/P60 family protein n=1 Tax=Marininema mesophilum TaxID=1048340 RepID=A0A1H2ZVE6_9BACL|nr:C40 family peptidase [Marininema mesophilum]SDX21267.1 NlpC/P60 family protein [Marininema mesophilum]